MKLRELPRILVGSAPTVMLAIGVVIGVGGIYVVRGACWAAGRAGRAMRGRR
jgi:hypothetical protein